MDKKLVIIPTYNEKENVEKIIRKVLSVEGDFHVLIIDDNSPDGTASIVEKMLPELSDRLFLEKRSGKLGLGTAYIYGFKWALSRNYDYVFEMDADFSHNPDDLVRLYRAVVDGADVAVGSRYVSGVNVVNWPMKRILLSYYASAYVRIITGIHVRDTTAGFMCYSARALKALDLDNIKFIGYAFQIEMKYSIWKLGGIVKEVPIIFYDRTEGQSKMTRGIFKEAVLGVIQLKFRNIKKLHHGFSAS